jgi:hypothetical protein
VLALLSLASTRQLYSSEGVLAKGDMTFPSDLAQLMRYIEEYLYVWDNKVFAGYPRTTLQDHLFWAFSLLPFIVCLPSPWVGPAWISFLIFTSGLSMFFFAKKLSGSRLGAMVAAIIYMLSNFQSDNILAGHRGFIMAYAIAPVALLFYERAVRTGRLSDQMLAGGLLALTFSSMHMGIMVISVLILRMSWLVVVERSRVARPSMILLRSFIVVFICVATNMFWILPYVQYTFSIGGLYWYRYSIESVTFWRYSRLNRIGDYLMLGSPLPWYTKSIYESYSNLATYYLHGYLVASIALFSLMRSPKKSRGIVLFMGVLVVIGAAMAAGPNPPLGDLYLWLYENFPPMILFERPIMFEYLIALAYPVMTAITLSEITELVGGTSGLNFYLTLRPSFNPQLVLRFKRQVFSSVIFAVISGTLLLPLAFAPITEGDFYGRIRIISFPPEHQQVYNWLASSNVSGRVLLIPPYDCGKFSWFPRGGDNVNESYPSFFKPIVIYPPRPLITIGWGYNYNPYSTFIIDSLYLGRNFRAGKLLTTLGVKYILISLDEIDLAKWNPDLHTKHHNTSFFVTNVLPSLEGLREVWRSGNVVVLENMLDVSELALSPTFLLVSGDRRVINALTMIEDFVVQDNPVVFATQLEDQPPELLQLADTVVIFGESSFDLVLPLARSKLHLNPWKFARHSSNFHKEWTPSTVLVNYFEWLGDFCLEGPQSDTGNWMITEGEGAHVDGSFTIDVPGYYDVWAKVYTGYITFPGPYTRGKVSIRIDDNSWNISTVDFRIGAFRWIRLGKIYLKATDHSFRVENVDGLNIIGDIVLLPNSEFPSICDVSDLEILKGKNIVYVFEFEQMASNNLTWPAINCDLYASNGMFVMGCIEPFQFEVLKEDDYDILIRVRGQAGQKTRLCINEDSRDVTIMNSSFHYILIPNVHLKKGANYLRFTNQNLLMDAVAWINKSFWKIYPPDAGTILTDNLESGSTIKAEISGNGLRYVQMIFDFDKSINISQADVLHLLFKSSVYGKYRIALRDVKNKVAWYDFLYPNPLSWMELQLALKSPSYADPDFNFSSVARLEVDTQQPASSNYSIWVKDVGFLKNQLNLDQLLILPKGSNIFSHHAEPNIPLHLIEKSTNPCHISFSLSPELPSSTPVIIVFFDSYDKSWVMSDYGTHLLQNTVYHFPVWSYANGFVLNVKGATRLSITYNRFRYQIIGTVLSVLSWAVLGAINLSQKIFQHHKLPRRSFLRSLHRITRQS